VKRQSLSPLRKKKSSDATFVTAEEIQDYFMRSLKDEPLPSTHPVQETNDKKKKEKQNVPLPIQLPLGTTNALELMGCTSGSAYTMQKSLDADGKHRRKSTDAIKGDTIYDLLIQEKKKSLAKLKEKLYM
jgi:hypothetical protein